ncbi:helix-turn-helix transcriptional regulator [Argonema antarcticum]|uniref:helix-turn-helix transcriptional regulator n=1 Tax=Argonema antarcticum TaxID=2942763 RepID=UPI00201168BD|nr:NACHT domain-containing protein [Argonema antarcticum A004/B2]
MIPQDFLQTIARKHGVSDTELEALSLAMDGQTTPAIARQLAISEDAVRKRLSEIYQKFHISGRGPVKLAQLQQLLVSQYQAQQHTDRTNPVAAISDTPHQDWGEAPDVSVFYGRTKELAILEEWIIKDNCRLVALLGMPGIGKSFLAHKLAQQIQDEFKIVIWRSLRNAPPLLELLADFLKTLPHSSELDLPKTADEGISRLIGYLRQHRCLLVLDGVETILRNGDRFGRYSKGYEGYGIFLRRIGEEQHQSCLLVSTQEKPGEIIRLESANRLVRSLQLEGLNSEAAKEILQSKNLTGEECWDDLIKLYRGNPLALKLAIVMIEDIFNKDVAKFIKLGTTVLSPDYRELLDDLFKRLSDLEKEVVKSLANQNKPTSFEELRSNMTATLSASELIEALASLGGRSLIEKFPNKDTSEIVFTLQPVVKKYVQKSR